MVTTCIRCKKKTDETVKVCVRDESTYSIRRICTDCFDIASESEQGQWALAAKFGWSEKAATLQDE